MNHIDSPWAGFAEAADFDRFRATLAAAEFTPEGIADALGRTNLLATSEHELPSMLHRTRGDCLRDLLIRLFFLERAVDSAPLDRHLGEETLRNWIEAGVLSREGECIAARMRILPYRDLYFASDLAGEIRQGARADFVMNLGHASELLAFAAIEPTGGDTLDMAAGCGALGLLAAARSRSVLATDINPRAIAFTEFNARLNGIAGLTAVAGDMFAPASGRTFQRIVCNPPFVIAPQARYIFRDSARRGDDFCRELARAAPPLIAEGGYFQMLANCPHIRGRDWRADWQEWFDDLGCDVIVWANQTDSIRDYAATWIRDTESTEAEGHVERFDEWMRYYEGQGIEAVTYGVVTMRRRSGSNYVIIDDAERKIVGPCGRQIEQAFDWIDQVRRLASESQLLDVRFRLAAEAQLTETFAVSAAGSLAPAAASIRLAGGVEIESQLDAATVAVLQRCDGHWTLRQIVPAIAARFTIAPETLEAALPTIVHQLASRGYVEPAVAS